MTTDSKQEFVRVLEPARRQLKNLMDTMALLIGSASATAIFRSVARRQARHFPFLAALQVMDGAIFVQPIAAEALPADMEELLTGMNAVVDGVIVLLTDLTGEVLMSKLAEPVAATKHAIAASVTGGDA